MLYNEIDEIQQQQQQQPNVNNVLFTPIQQQIFLNAQAYCTHIALPSYVRAFRESFFVSALLRSISIALSRLAGEKS